LAIPGDRRFLLHTLPNPIGVYAGQLPDSRQALVGCSWDDKLVVAVFDCEGNLRESHRVEVPTSDVPGYLKSELGFTSGEVCIKEIRIPEDAFAVYCLPDLYQRFLSNPNDPWFTDDDRQDLPGVIKQWLKSGQFVLEWGNDYWLNRDGEVVATYSLGTKESHRAHRGEKRHNHG
jgi:hypothetical protein